MPIDVQGGYEGGFYVGPTIFDLDGVELKGNAVWEEEIFGPVLCVKSFETEEEGFVVVVVFSFLFLFLFLFFLYASFPIFNFIPPPPPPQKKINK